jgi:nucleotide-binding universal stress UspA family protein
MFKHLLLPTDGSPRSEAAIQKGITFAKSINAKVTGLHVIPGIPMVPYPSVMIEDPKEYEAQLKAQAERATYPWSKRRQEKPVWRLI